MKRSTLRIAIFLVIGAVLNIAITWALAAWLPHQNLERRYNLVNLSPSGAFDYVGVYELSRPGMLRRTFEPQFSAGSTHRRSLWDDLSPKATSRRIKSVEQDRSWGNLPLALTAGNHAPRSGQEDARGWPALAFWCSLDEGAIIGLTTDQPAPGGIPISRTGGTARTSTFRALPFLPIWSGIIINTIFYAIAGGTLTGASWSLRRAWRRFKHRCAGCGYNLTGNTTGACPECGAAWRLP